MKGKVHLDKIWTESRKKYHTTILSDAPTIKRKSNYFGVGMGQGLVDTLDSSSWRVLPLSYRHRKDESRIDLSGQ